MIIVKQIALNEADFILKLDGLFSDGGWRWPSIHLDSKLSHTQSLGLIIPRGQYVTCPSEFSVIRLRIRHRNALTEKAWEDALQGIAKHALRLGEGGQNHDETTPPPSPKKPSSFLKSTSLKLRKGFEYRPLVWNVAHSRPELVSLRPR